MTKINKQKLFLLLGSLIVLYFILSYFGWVLYLDRAKNRVGTEDIDDAKRRGVFVKKLHYVIIDSPNVIIGGFEPFIERGYRYGLNSVQETRSLEGSNYPFTVSFKPNPNKDTSIFALPNELIKFDSSDAVWGYMKDSTLKDTIYLEVYNVHNYANRKLVKMWE